MSGCHALSRWHRCSVPLAKSSNFTPITEIKQWHIPSYAHIKKGNFKKIFLTFLVWTIDRHHQFMVSHWYVILCDFAYYFWSERERHNRFVIPLFFCSSISCCLEIEDSAPKFLLDLYQSVLDSDSGLVKWNGSPDTTVILEGETLSRSSLKAINASDKIISFANQVHRLSSSSSSHDRRGHHRRLFFDVSEVSPEDEVMGCELRIYRSLADSYYPSNWTYTVSVYQIIDKEDHKSLRKLDSKKVGLHDNGWILFNVTKSLLKWTFSGMTNHGLVVKVKHDDFGMFFSRKISLFSCWPASFLFSLLSKVHVTHETFCSSFPIFCHVSCFLLFRYLFVLLW